ncbi:MAG: ABC transporter ATP-binding protein/permease [Candidatus Eisenbacteria bacterium]|uniref:ABC transporter ATP-binding protein/permease n=1 Tax=Eiseniibacteriota bacterium TaxID=2212470 RepID=A0A948W4N3_UNCEI|nr:ABC transporter ATP-binding protein/permease [Candidatus Eisenbacteria bacterium]
MFWDDEDDPNLEGEQRARHLSARQMLMGRILPLFRPYRGKLLLSTLMMFVVVAAELGGPLLVRHVLDKDIPGNNGAGIVIRAVAYALLFGVGMGMAYLQVIVMVKVGLKIVTGLRQKVFSHLMTLSLAYFDKNPPGWLMARVESDVERLLILFSEVSIAIFRNGVLLIGTFLVMLFASVKVTLTILAIMTPIIFSTYFFLRYIRKGFRTVRRLYAKISGFLTEYVQGIPILQIYGYTEKARMDLMKFNQDKYVKEVKLAYVEYGFWGIFSAMEIVAVMMIIYVSAPQVLGATMTIGTLILFIEYTRRLFWPLLMFSEQLNFIQRAFASADRVFELLDTPSRTPDRPGASSHVPAVWEEMAFENVSFSYDGGAKALDNVSFRVRRGEKIALVGLSGGGKTTVTNMILRYYEPQAGFITLDRVDIREYKQGAWRKKIGLVLQDIHLFPGSLGDNLRVLRDEIPKEALDRAIRVVHAEEMIQRLPKGYDTELSEGGTNLSMGERQLLCFARAVVEDPDILILDEATSSVDPMTEQKIQASLDHLMEGRTSLIVAHRLATITKADRILVLHEGALAEEGTHDELYQKGGIYRDLFDLQFAAQSGAEGGNGKNGRKR